MRSDANAVFLNMRLSDLRLCNFRNYAQLEFVLQPGFTVLYGANGQGKTNFLEAVYYLSLLRSFRTGKMTDLLGFGSSFFRLEANLEKDSPWLSRDVLTITQETRRTLQINRKPVTKAASFINQFMVVAMTPQDLDLVKGGPSIRRRFCNILAGQTWTGYLDHLINYTVALRNRNAVLRNPGRFGKASLKVYNKLLIEHGVPIVKARKALVDRLNARLPREASGIGELEGSLHLRYEAGRLGTYASRSDPSADNFEDAQKMADEYWEILLREQHKDEEQGVTRHGPHRDDFIFLRDRQPLLSYASEGQIRSFVLALRLTASALLRQAEPERPLVLLVDDVFGELDQTRRRYFLEAIALYPQTILTCTARPPELDSINHMAYMVRQGRLIGPH